MKNKIIVVNMITKKGIERHCLIYRSQDKDEFDGVDEVLDG